MSWRVHDYSCQCGKQWEELVDSKETTVTCECGKKNEPILSAPALALFSILDKEDQAKALRKRSREHTKKQLKKDPTSIKQTKFKAGKK